MTAPAPTDPRTLTEQHRIAQLRIRAAGLRDFLRIVPIWNGDKSSFADLILATRPLVDVYRDASSALAVSYYEAARAAQQIAGDPTPKIAAAIDTAQLAKSMYVTGDRVIERALQRGVAAPAARTDAITGLSGAISRHILNAGRQSVIDSVNADRLSVGWARVTDSQPCAFCALLASRGAVYKSEETADFQAHDHCGCSIMPVYGASVLPDTSKRWKQVYNRAQREAEANGTLDRGTSNDRLNAFRRALAADLGTEA